MFRFLKLFLFLMIGILVLVGCDDSKNGNPNPDKEAPVITIKGDNPVTIEKDTKYTDSGATAKDNVDGAVTVVTSGSVKTSTVGTYIITYKATDGAGNKATVTRKVIVRNSSVVDTVAPVITIKGDNPATVEQDTVYTDAGATATDNIDGAVTVVSSGSVDTSTIGTYTITYTATDKAGNKTIKTREVTVVLPPDTTPPVITITGDNPATVEKDTTYTDTGATAMDDRDGRVTVVSSGSVDTSTVGTYTITYTATDKARNQAIKTRKVKVILPPDTTPPVITIIGDNPLEITQGETFSDPGATAMDDRDGVVTVTPSGTVDMDNAGDYNITYTAKDHANNETNATRVVTVKPAEVVWDVSTVTEFRQALEDAAANGEHDRIILGAGTYNTTSDGLGTFKFNDNEAFNLTIESGEGLTNQDVVLSGDNSTQVFNFNNTKDSTLILKKVSIINGNSSTNGSGVYSSKNIQIEDSKISNNTISGRYIDGGGFYSNGITKVKNSTISNNSSSGYGGGFCSKDTTSVLDSTISDNISSNSGGGFYSTGATMVTDSAISDNNSSNDGGGFFSNSDTTVKGSTIFNNGSSGYISFGGGFFSKGITTAVDSTIYHNSSLGYRSSGGGFYSANRTKVENLTIFDNISSYQGGGFDARAITTVTDSTIFNNSSETGGGFSASQMTIVTNSVFFNNSATNGASFNANAYPNVYSYISNNTFIRNRGSLYARGIFVNNIFDSNDEDIALKGISKIYNNYIDYDKIDEDENNVIKKHNLQPSSVGDIYIDDNNKTLMGSSPAIDKGLNPSSATFKKIIDNDTIYNQMVELLKTDMVGNNRVHNGTVDMGAVEFGSSK